ncbi:LeuA family protein [Halorussus sp. MSC15.2]|uniref:LeuA family protein n=1 Tax=Halorussus sp. MSC15.2 TaxID=2283638 RepID=UPI0019672EA9|nr:LeuA family protein [Halorussus sp. MSC15.2]
MTISFKDLTLREGSQVPGLEITDDVGKRVLDGLARVNVGRVEVSFPRAAPREELYRHAESLGLRTAALARAVPADVDAALDVEPDEIEVIVNSSDVQLEHALGKTREESLDLLRENVERAVEGGVAAGATLMDAVRADNDHLRAGARVVRDAGGRHVTLADTTGAGDPEAVRETVAAVADEVGGDLAVTIHTHDDMGVATANAVAGVDAGADSVDATVGGVGERAGNAPLEEVAVLGSERGDDVALELPELVPACREILDALDVDYEGKPVLGREGYRHESGLHTAAMLREPSTYEPFDPERYGAERELLFGRGTGSGGVRALLDATGLEATDEQVAVGQEALRDAAAERGEPLSREAAAEVVAEAVES